MREKDGTAINMMDNIAKLQRSILYCCQLIYPKYPAYFFPVFIFLQIVKKISFDIKVRCLKFHVIPIPNQLFDSYIESNLIKSEHTLFVSKTVFTEYIVEKELNWINLTILMKNPQKKVEDKTDNKIVSTILNKQNISVLCQVFPGPSMPLNAIFVKENLYYNLIEKHKVNLHFCANLTRIPEQQTLPQIATKANIFLYNTPYELTSDMIDYILGKYFETPQFLYRNHTYQIDLNEKFLGNTFYTKNFTIFSHLTKLYFKCVNLESADSNFEMYAVVGKNFTTLQQTSTFNSFLPKQHLDNHCFVESYPRGLKKYFDELKSSITPFLKHENNSLIENQIYPIFMLQGDRGSGKLAVCRAVAQNFGMQVFYADCTDIMTNVLSQTEVKLAGVLNKANVCEPLIICFQNFEVFGIDIEGHEDSRILSSFQAEINSLYSKKHGNPIILVALSNEKDSTKTKINSIFLEIIKVLPPTSCERASLLKWIGVKESCPIDIQYLKKIAEQTQGFLLDDLKLLYSNAIQQMHKSRNIQLGLAHFEKCLENMQSSFSDSLGAPKVPKVLWSEIGGLAKLKTEIQNSIGLPLRHKNLMGKNMRRSGILLYGPPGTGKTLIAKAVATECNLSFLSVQGPELLNMYVGQSEENVREVFSRARSASPCVLFLDELDSLAPNRGVSGDSGGVMDRVVSQMLSEMDGISKDPEKQIFILAATNRPDLIDPALLRPGRFDKLLYVGPCTIMEDKESVLKAIASKFKLTKDLTLRKIAETLREDMTGADLYSICSNAWLSAVRRTISTAASDKTSDEEITSDKITVNFEDFQMATRKFIPSISRTDMDYFNKLKSNFSV